MDLWEFVMRLDKGRPEWDTIRLFHAVKSLRIDLRND